jgi:undecaprenyl-diphosphatase
MQDILEAIILGIIQGLTEFLPVSSSGHLELGKFILGSEAVPEESLLMTVVLHFATALSTVVVFRKDISTLISNVMTRKGDSKDMAFVWFIILSMVPAVFVGLVFEKQIESLFSQNILLVSCMLLVTATLLWFTYKAPKQTGELNIVSAFIIGVSQAIAILPGISRSGATISTALYLGVSREQAARFSFLMVIPLIFGKMAKDVMDGNLSGNAPNIMPLIAGGLAAFITGYFACSWMIKIVKQSKLSYFAIYCFIVGLAGILFSYIYGS